MCDVARVLVIGVDPTQFDQWDPEPILAGIAAGRARFVERGIDAQWCLVDLRDQPEAALEAALTSDEFACVVIGGGVRSGHGESPEFFEKVINLVRVHAPGAAIAFNTRPEDCLDAALRWLP
jgi:hypothetical protein